MWDELTTRLEGQIVVLEPLQVRHKEGLFAAAQHPEIRLKVAQGSAPT